MSRKSIRRAALGLLAAVLLGIAVPAPASAWSGDVSAAGFFAQVWEWLEGLWPDPVETTTCTGDDCGDGGYGADPNG